MAFEPGTRLGIYEIVAVIGAGGMGEVYRARDTRLNRDVALKVLPELFAENPERLARFKREAQVLASLNHPNIAAIHGFEDGDGTLALALELVEGPTLAERIAQGRLPLDEALPIARQIVEALEAAHERGIVHRDLKPANIKIRPDGTVKILDFGLAKALEAEHPAASTLSMSPTITSPAATRAGMILGTAAYMSPEQARGKPVDKRSDIWSFGCVLYEMLAGTRPFDGESVTDVLARIIEREPDYNALPAEVPFTIRRLLRRCLEKDRRQRLPDIGTARLDIDEALAAPASWDVTPVAPARRGRERAIWAAALVATAIGAAAAAWYARPAPPAMEVRFAIPVRPMRWANEIDISPDGRRVVYAAATDSGDQGLWIRDLNAERSRVLPGTESATGDTVSPRWSPDGRSVVFAAGGDLRTIDVDGGAPQTIVKGLGGQMSGANWNRDGVIVFATINHGLRRVEATGGEVTAVSERDGTLGEIYHEAPFFLPDQRRFLYLAWGNQSESRAIYVGALDSPSRTRLMQAESQAVYAEGHLLFLRGGTLMARPFDVNSLQFTGEARPIADGVSLVAAELGAFSASANGALIFKSVDPDAGNRQLLWMDRDGKAVPAADEPFEIGGLNLSPDDTRVVFTEGNPPDVWVYDVVRRVKSRLTTDPAIDHNPAWSADGSRVLFDSHRRLPGSGTASEGAAIFEKASNGATPDRLLFDGEPGTQQSPLDSSRDGRTLVFRRVAPTGVWNLWTLPLDGDRKPVPYREGPFNETEARLSPDGRWLAYSSNESGRAEVVVQPFPDPSGGKWQISTDGGVTPRWRADGRELYYLDSGGRMVASAVTTGSTFTVESVGPLFRTPLPLPIPPGGALGVYDVTADGKRFLVAVPPAGATPAPINVVLNWTAALRRQLD